MKIKGTAVKSTPLYVKERFKNEYREWLSKLPADSRAIMEKPIDVTNWYPLTESVITPTQLIGKMFFKDEMEAAFEIGRYSAEIALKGVYKVFVLVSTPAFIISRAAKIFSTYYDPAEINILENADHKAVIEVRKFKEKDCLIAHRIAGWMYKALEITRKSNISYTIDCDFSMGKERILINMNWK